MDISNFLNWFLREFLSLFTFSFSLLDRITFNGTSLLQFCLTVLLISVILNVVISVAGRRGLTRYLGRNSGHGKGSNDSSGKSDGGN